MKWVGVLIIMLYAPMSAQAGVHWKAKDMPGAWVEILSDTLDRPERPSALHFFIEPREGGDHVRANVRLFIPKNQSSEAIQKGRCELWVNKKLMDGLGEYWIMGNHGRELWFPNMGEQDRMVLSIAWKQAQVVDYATMETENSHGPHTRTWKTERIERSSHLREFSLDDVCDTFTSEAFAKMD